MLHAEENTYPAPLLAHVISCSFLLHNVALITESVANGPKTDLRPQGWCQLVPHVPGLHQTSQWLPDFVKRPQNAPIFCWRRLPKAFLAPTRLLEHVKRPDCCPHLLPCGPRPHGKEPRYLPVGHRLHTRLPRWVPVEVTQGLRLRIHVLTHGCHACWTKRSAKAWCVLEP